MQHLELQIGNIAAHLINDGDIFAEPHILFTNIEQAELAPRIERSLEAEGSLRAPRNVLLARVEGTAILVDTGFGDFAAALGYPASRLLDALDDCNTPPNEITHVVLTHAHGDHIGGVTGANGLAFPQATHHVHANEIDFWLSPESDAQPEPIRTTARQQLSILKRSGQLHPFDAETELVRGIHVEPAPGHTPGHAIVTLESEGDTAVFLGDAVLDPLNFQCTHCIAAMDVSPVQTVQTRRNVLARAAREHSLVLASHIGAAGYVEPQGSAFRFVPTDGGSVRSYR